MTLLAHLSPLLPALNATLLPALTPTHLRTPIYHTSAPSILSWISDKHLSLVAPIFLYWALSLLFHAIDSAQLPYFERMRIHESPEVLSRNKATVLDVVKAVIFQQVVQTALGVAWLESEEDILRREVHVDHLAAMSGLSRPVGQLLLLALGGRHGEDVIKRHGAAVVQWVYWWGIPTVQLLFAFFVIDTWQYFLHRLFHTVPFLYRNFHSVHHRLYVPYAFGALYNHPVEGLLLDTLGAAIAHSSSLMTVRQAVLLFSFSTIKTVDDHCGYKIWWDPCQMLFGNNADYHDIHHQAWGIKKNFSQPFFTNWDDLLGTRLTRQQANKRSSRTARPALSTSLPQTLSRAPLSAVPELEEPTTPEGQTTATLLSPLPPSPAVSDAETAGDGLRERSVASKAKVIMAGAKLE